MQVVSDLDRIAPALAHPVMAIGVFDGVHRGHQAVLGEVVARAHARAGTAVVLSFFPHPQKVIASSDAPPLLQTFDQQAELLEQLGLDLFIRLPFTRQLSLLSPQEFVRDILVRTGIREVLVGENFRFGHKRAGDFSTLLRLGEEWGFRVRKAPIVVFRGARISSTRIRSHLKGGSVHLAKRMLSRPYEIRGSIIKGAMRGMRLGFPTANIRPENELIPATGVYATRARVDGTRFVGATNIGYRPTVHGFAEREATVETHLLGFTGDIYGREMSLEFCYRIREERRFENVQALIHQIREDILCIEKYSRRVDPLMSERENEIDQG
ncbi:MAG: bifunctional riboflavin kinase/FAD synthetase [Acidobacteriota bacterium]